MEIQTKNYDIAKVRESFPVLKEVTYLNVGTYGIMPEPALTKFMAIQQNFEQGGLASRGAKINAWSGTEDTRRRIAELIGATPDEIAFNRNATDGINFVLSGIDWKPGDEVVTTVQEHEAINHPLLYLQKTKGIKVRFVEVSPEPEVMIERLKKVVNSKTRLIGMSYVTCETGTRLPAKEICQWASENILLLTLFDGAQASGAMPIKVRELGCDFYASNGHKWLCGPKGTGFFYGKLEKIDQLSPAHIGAGSLERADLATGDAEVWPNSKRFEFGTRAWGLTAGLGCSLDWYESLGWENVYDYIVSLTGYFKERLLEKPFLKLLTPLEFEKSSGLTSFVFEGRSAHEISKILRENWRFNVRVVPHYNCIRISTAHFVSQSDIDKLMDSLDKIYREKL